MEMTYVNDNNITLKAKAVMTAIINAGENFGNTVQDICALCGIGVYAVRTAVIELEKAGYLKRERERRGNGTLGKMQYVICSPRNCKMKKTNTKIIVFPKAYVKYCNEKIYEAADKVCADGTKLFAFCTADQPAASKAICANCTNDDQVSVATSDNLTLVENTQPNIGENGFIKPTSPMLDYPILDDKEKQEKEKRSKKEKEINRQIYITNNINKNKAYEKEKNVTSALCDVIKKQIGYKELTEDQEIASWFVSRKAQISAVDMVVQIMCNAAKNNTSKIDGVSYDRDVIIKEYLVKVDFNYVKSFLGHITCFNLPHIVTPVRYWSSAFLNFGSELRYFNKHASNFPRPTSTTTRPEEKEDSELNELGADTDTVISVWNEFKDVYSKTLKSDLFFSSYIMRSELIKLTDTTAIIYCGNCFVKNFYTERIDSVTSVFRDILKRSIEIKLTDEIF